MSEYVELNCFSQSRHEKSLGLLTKKFVNLLECADGGVLDLKIVSIHLIKKNKFY